MTSSIDEDEAAPAPGTDIAIVGMACRFPRARTAEEFWANVRDGVECITFFTDEELRAAGVDGATLRDPSYVKAGGALEGVASFDPAFFGFSARDGTILDPQHRHFLEVAWEALEHAGHPPESFEGRVGVFGGSGMNAYMPFNLFTNPALMESMGLFLVRHTGNDKDFLTTRVSYCLDLRGPSVNVQTACSTSLVAVHYACQSLLGGECDMALAGGVTIELPHGRGYHYREGEILSPDGHCRPFDHRSRGTVFGSGAGIVVLRRLEDALADGDTIHAVIKGTAVNNDGGGKIGYLAPSVEGQAAAIVEALNVSGMSADALSYVECHGTATPVGDPIEITALTQAFRATTARKGYVGIGSVKSNIGHLDTAAGVASLIKLVHMLKHKQLAPSLHFEKPNPQIDFAESPFYVNHELKPWARADGPRRGGVSSLGVGGTNAFAVVEEAEESVAVPERRPFQVLALSARTEQALDRGAARLADHLERKAENLAEVSHTLFRGRRRFSKRRVLVASSAADAARLLRSGDPQRVVTVSSDVAGAGVVFMFPGGGSQYPNMALDVYASEPVFRRKVDECLDLLQRREKLDLRPLMFPAPGGEERAAADMQQMGHALPALLTIELAYAALWESWGVRPQALVGHSVGEYAAAHVAGVVSLADVLSIVCGRGRLMASAEEGVTLSVSLSEAEIRPFLGDLDLGVINGPEASVVSGRPEAIERLERTLGEREVECRRLKIRVAAHSALLDPVLPAFDEVLGRVRFDAPKLPYLSNVTGTWIKPAEATSRAYWVQHLRRTVRFSDNLIELFRDKRRVLLEVGPGQVLSALARHHTGKSPDQVVVASSRHPQENVGDLPYVQGALGRLWAAGVDPDFPAYFEGESRRRVVLPTYSFDHERYWVEPGNGFFLHAKTDVTELSKQVDLASWFYRPAFRESALPATGNGGGQTWLGFVDRGRLLDDVLAEARARGHRVVRVAPGAAFAEHSPDSYEVRPAESSDYERLFERLSLHGLAPDRIVHAWGLSGDHSNGAPASGDLASRLDESFYSLLRLAQVLGSEDGNGGVFLGVLGDGSVSVLGEPLPFPEKAVALGPVRVVPKELPDVRATYFDLPAKAALGRDLAKLVASELEHPTDDAVVAYRDGKRFVEAFERHPVERAQGTSQSIFREGGVYLVTGGLGGMGLTFAEHLARTYRAKIVLVGQTGLPDPDAWDAWVELHGERDPISVRIHRVRQIILAGGQVRVERASVENAADMRAVFDRTRATFGGPNGVIHAAGVLDDGLLQLKDRESVERVLAPKVRGAMALAELARSYPLDVLLFCSSTSSILGPAGQIDYTAANAYLNALAQHLAPLLPGTRVLALDWGVWRTVGMAVQAASQLPPLQGDPIAHPLLSRRRELGDGGAVCSGVLDARTFWVLADHRIRGGQAVLPGTAYLELARVAFEAHLGKTEAIELREVSFVAPLVVPDEEPRHVEVTLEKSHGEAFSFVVRSRGGGAEWLEHARGVVSGGAPASATLSVDPRQVANRCNVRQVLFEPGAQTLPQDQGLEFGPRWKVLREMRFGTDEAVARFELPPPFARDVETFALHPGLLDMASGFAFSLLDRSTDTAAVYVPVSYRRVRMYGPLPARGHSVVHRFVQKPGERHGSLDFVITDDDGRTLLAVEGYVVTSLDPHALEAPRALSASGAGRQPNLLERWLAHGIEPEEGVEVLERALSVAAFPVLVASSIDLYTALAEVRPRRQVQSSAPEPAAKRPALDTAFAAPRDDIERKLAELWQSLLGVESIGIRDNFFELGGHSLIAVRLFARIKKAYGLDLSLAVLFEAPTIEACAAVLRAELGITLAPSEAGGEKAAAPAAPRINEWSPLVPIHREGGRLPFFCVHGAGGNVLNFHALSRGLGKDQPFFGLQASGVDGKRAPLDTIDEMADLYLGAILKAFPDGPYLLGGYSGGGVVAYEMAQRLLAKGRRVPLVVFLDTFHPHTEPKSLTLRDHAEQLRAEGPGYLGRRVRFGVERRFQELRTELRIRYFNQLDKPLPHELREVQLTQGFLDANRTYRPVSYPGRVVLFRAEDVAGAFAHVGPELGWEDLISDLVIHPVPGGHDDLVLEPNVQILTRLLRDALDDAQPSSSREQARKEVRP